MSGKSEQESILRGQRELRAAVVSAMRLLGTNERTARTSRKIGGSRGASVCPVAAETIDRHELTDTAVAEVISNIEMFAAADADHMGRFVDDMVDHLQSVGCTSKREVNKFFRMARQTLASLYSAASKPQPSPSELMRLALRFALDPRKPIEGDVGRFHLEQVNNGWRVVEYPSVARKVPAIPLPGRLIRSLYAVRILDHLHHDPTQLYRLMGLIETILGCVPTEKDCLHEKLRAAKPPNVPKIKVDLEEANDIVWLNGKPVSVGLAQTYFLDAVVGAKGDWISSTEITESEKHRAAVGSRPDRVFRSLPRKISSLLEAKRAKGFRLRVT